MLVLFSLSRRLCRSLSRDEISYIREQMAAMKQNSPRDLRYKRNAIAGASFSTRIERICYMKDDFSTTFEDL